MRPPAVLRSKRHLALPLALIVAAVSGCGAEPPPRTADGPSAQEDAAEQQTIGRSKAKIAEAERALSEKDYDDARKALREAQKLGVESHDFEIKALLEKIDKRDAKVLATEAAVNLKAKDCAAAFKELTEAIETVASEVFTREIRRLTADPALQCVQSVVDEATMGGDYSAARALIDAAETQVVLGPTAGKKLKGELDATVEDGMKGIVADDLEAKKWPEAMAKLDAATKKGDATEAQIAAVLGAIRAAITPEVEVTLQKGLGSRDAAAALKKADQLIALVRWSIPAAGAGAPPPPADAAAPPTVPGLSTPTPVTTAVVTAGNALPEPLRQKREVLAVFVEGQRAGMKPVRKAEKRWTHGKISVLPAAQLTGESRRDLQPATEVWVIGTTKDKALVADADPGDAALAGMLAKAVGWVPLAQLAKTTTIDWVPPDSQLKGVRVWGPLRPPDAMLELGIVSEITGKDVKVKRLADDVEIKVPRRSLRSGRLARGTKLLAFCTTKDQPAVIEQIVNQGRAVSIKCEKGEVKDELLPSLRTKAELLPPSP